jgi:hypothetical protein
MWQAFGFRADSRLGPLLAAIPGLLAAAFVLGRRLTGTGALAAWPCRAEALHFLLLAAAIAGIRYVGFLPSIAAYLTVMLLVSTHLRLMAVVYAAGLVALAYGLMQLLDIRLA